ncbi:MAG: phosphoribosylformylglycinamidine synthase subunit PurL [Chloroflexota bacterium]
MHRVEISLKRHLPDARGMALARDIADLGISTVHGVRVLDIYRFDGKLRPDELELICRKLLSDTVTQEYRYDPPTKDKAGAPDGFAVEVAYNPGVVDPVEATIMKSLLDLGISAVRQVRTARRYLLQGNPSQSEITEISAKLLVNPIIQHVVKAGDGSIPQSPEYHFKLETVDLSRDNDLLAKRFGFSREEFEAIRAHFSRLGRKPTDAEMETLAQTWSEHCVHKTFRGKIHLGDTTIDNLLKSTIVKVTRELDKPWCLSVFEDNAGVIDFDGTWALCFKVETHNHPSAVEPYGGAATGIGGVIRDILGTGLAARPILNTDVFCFAEPDLPYQKLPRGVLHPRRILKGVRAGVADYGNRLGIPTLNGAILFDRRYLANPLVYCGTVGIMPVKASRPGRQQSGDLVVLVGGRTGRDGIHGVTFASEQLTDQSSTLSYSSVQIGNPIVEKKMIDVLMQASERGLFRRITDCGGGGLSSAVGEMGEATGVVVYLDRVPLKYAGLTYAEIWVSESQERMLLAVLPEYGQQLIDLFAGEGVEATVIGRFTDDRMLRLYYQDNLVADLNMAFLHEGRPPFEARASWQPVAHPEPGENSFAPPDEALLKVLGSWNVCSKEWVIRQYDHEVQGASVLKPLVGRENDGPGDAAIIRPLLDSNKGVIIANGINPKFGDIDPYWMAASVIDEALRQVIAVGGSLERVALLDNFCWGDTRRPETLGALVRACQACYDIARVFGTPFISGKDSLNNEFEYEGRRIIIPHTLLISAIGIIEDAGRAVSMDFKDAGDLVYLVGVTRPELGGSEYFRAYGYTGNRVPVVNPEVAKITMDNLSRATAGGMVRACHDLSDGGLGVALAEMALAGGLGAEVRLAKVPLAEKIERDDFILFSESNSRFLVEVAPGDRKAFEKTLRGAAIALIGEVTGSGVLNVYGLNGKGLISKPVGELKEAWQRPMNW